MPRRARSKSVGRKGGNNPTQSGVKRNRSRSVGQTVMAAAENVVASVSSPKATVSKRPKRGERVANSNETISRACRRINFAEEIQANAEMID